MDSEERNNLYRERNMCVSLIVKMANDLGYEIKIKDKDSEWPIIFVSLPMPDGTIKQVSWHLPQAELKEFMLHIYPDMTEEWDGHTTEEKYQRVLGY